MLLLNPLPKPQTEQGYAAHYRKGLMEQVARNRGMKKAPCMISRLQEKDLGKWFIVEGVRTGKKLLCRVADVNDPKHHARTKKKGIIVELDYKSNKVICGYYGPPNSCKVKVYEFRSN